MAKGTAKVLETDSVIFPMKFGQEKQEIALTENTENKILIEEKIVETSIEGRFLRLKKSLRKRSVSIL